MKELFLIKEKLEFKINDLKNQRGQLIGSGDITRILAFTHEIKAYNIVLNDINERIEELKKEENKHE